MIKLDYQPREWQMRVHKGRRRFSVVVTHRRAGKTRLAVMQLLDSALRHQMELGLFVYLAPYREQARTIAWSQLKRDIVPLLNAGMVVVREMDLSITFQHNGATVRLFGADNPDALRGLRLDGVVMDEVAQMRPETWHDVVRPALSDRMGWAMFIGTPNGVNLFSEIYFKALRDPEWFAASFPVDATQALDPDEVNRLRRGMPDQSFAREYLCDFSASGEDQLIGLAEAEKAAHRRYAEATYEMAPKVLGVDPARFGNDRSVIMRRQGLQAFEPAILRGVDNMDLASRVAAEIREWGPQAVFIDAGAGAGVIDRLRQLRHNVIEIPFGGAAMSSDLYNNRRTEMWWALREWIASGGAIPDSLSLKQELATPTYKYDSSGRRALESKEAIKKRLPDRGSPDIADALALTFALPVAAPSVAEMVADRVLPRRHGGGTGGHDEFGFGGE